MNSRQRLKVTFNFEEPDRVCLFEPWIEPEIYRMLGGDPYRAREFLKHDCFPLSHHPVDKTRAYGNGIDEWGRLFQNGEYGGGLVKSEVDLEKYNPPLSHAADWFPQEKLIPVKKKYRESFALYFAWHDCSLGLSYMAMGFQTFFQALYDNLELVEAIIERSTNWTIALVEQANANGVDFIVLGDDSADSSRPFISPQMFKKLILPQYKRITRSSSVPIIWHSDGQISPLLPLIVEAGFAGVHSLEPNVGIDLQEIKHEYGDRLVLCGNLDTTMTLCQTNLTIVRKDVERCIREGAPGGGYLFSSANSLFKGHDINAITEAFHYALKIGTYPIAV